VELESEDDEQREDSSEEEQEQEQEEEEGEEQEEEEEDEGNRPGRTGVRLATKKRRRSHNADKRDERGGEKARKVVEKNPNDTLDARPMTNAAPLAYPYAMPVPYQSPGYYYSQAVPIYAPTAPYGQSYASTMPAYANPAYPIATYTNNPQQQQFRGPGDFPPNLDSQFREVYCPHCGRREVGYYCVTCGRRRQ
jgi:hypothetical protein